MTKRKPPGVSWETWVDRQIREGMERGEFDRLPGHGQPLKGLAEPHDELWWVRDKLRREGVSLLPPALALRKDLELAREAIARSTTEAAVRDIVDGINRRIRALNRKPIPGPPSNLMPLDVERTLTEWRSQHPGPETAAATAAEPESSTDEGDPPLNARRRSLRRRS